jgi:hypothetical protein
VFRPGRVHVPQRLPIRNTLLFERRLQSAMKNPDRGMVEVNDHLQTSVPNIYAL